MASRIRTAITTLAIFTAALVSTPAHAGCGCEKAPPVVAEVRPAVAYPGAAVTVFGSSLEYDETYTVTFTSGITGEEASVKGSAQILRDLADGQEKTQVVVALPDLPLGPASVTVSSIDTGDEILFIDDAAFTVAPAPVALPTGYGTWHDPSYQAAVGRDGTTYIALNLQQLTQPMVFEAQGLGYPLRFGGDDVLFYNIQGFLMQALTDSGTGEPVPGMFVFPPEDPTTDSDVIHYSRHEFTTYFLQHEERHPHEVDDIDPNWHLDGTPHIDHDHLILAISGQLTDGSSPAAGATPPFELVLGSHSLFHGGLVGLSSVTLCGTTTVDSYDPETGISGAEGDVYSNGQIQVRDFALLKGDATAADIAVRRKGEITGEQTIVAEATSVMEIQVPSRIPDLGAIDLTGSSMTIYGPGSFKVSDLALTGNSTLYVDNSEGPVTLYVTGGVSVSSDAQVLTSDPNPELFAVYVASTQRVVLQRGSQTAFHGVVYAPTSMVNIEGNSNFYGAFVGDEMNVTNDAQVHYYSALRSDTAYARYATVLYDPTSLASDAKYATPISSTTADASSTGDAVAGDAPVDDGSTTTDTSSTNPAGKSKPSKGGTKR